jgi:hypothetical protein
MVVLFACTMGIAGILMIRYPRTNYFMVANGPIALYGDHLSCSSKSIGIIEPGARLDTLGFYYGKDCGFYKVKLPSREYGYVMFGDPFKIFKKREKILDLNNLFPSYGLMSHYYSDSQSKRIFKAGNEP